MSTPAVGSGALASNGASASAQEVFAQLLRTDIAPWLRERGLVGSGQTFELRDGDYWLLVGFQRSRYSTIDEVEFTVHSVAVRKSTWELLRERNTKLAKRPATSNRVEASARRPDEIDPSASAWLTLSGDGSNLETVCGELTALLEATVLPWLRSYTKTGKDAHASITADEADGDFLV